VVASTRPPDPGVAGPGAGFNPLHCGAVVASELAATSDEEVSGRFNPLHCGAVVASDRRRLRRLRRRRVSIPFIAGQWSLPPARGAGPTPVRLWFQSPSLRGSGRFRLALAWGSRVSPPFQSPSLRGSGRFPDPDGSGGVDPAPVSIPFIAGQWSLPYC